MIILYLHLAVIIILHQVLFLFRSTLFYSYYILLLSFKLKIVKVDTWLDSLPKVLSMCP